MCGAAAFDRKEIRVELIRAVDIDIQDRRLGQRRQGYAGFNGERFRLI